jgi:hypothetical protein
MALPVAEKWVVNRDPWIDGRTGYHGTMNPPALSGCFIPDSVTVGELGLIGKGQPASITSVPANEGSCG